MLLYSDLAPWWPLLSPPSHYVEEAAELLPLLEPAAGMTLLELGSGGGSLASHLRPYFSLTLTDVSSEMLAVNRAINPGAEFVQGDMRTLRLERLFDRVLLHDAVMYMTSEEDLRAALTTARLHLRPGGLLVVLPDCVKETFEAETSHGGEDGADGRALRYLEWSWDPDPADTTHEVVYALRPPRIGWNDEDTRGPPRRGAVPEGDVAQDLRRGGPRRPYRARHLAPGRLRRSET